MEPLRVAFMRHVGPYNEVGQTWQRFCQWVGMRGLFGPDTKMLGISHDDPDVTPADKLRYDACVVVGEQLQPEGDVGVQQVAGGEHQPQALFQTALGPPSRRMMSLGRRHTVTQAPAVTA